MATRLHLSHARGAPRRRGLAAAALLGLALSTMAACSLLVEKRDQQCSADADCAQFAGAVCDTAEHVCKIKGGTGGGGGSTTSTTTSSTGTTTTTGTGGSGGGSCDGGSCYACEPATTEEFLNHCTTAPCKAFDRKRLTKLGADGKLPPLPMPGDAGDGG
jgi:hypothetical protein